MILQKTAFKARLVDHPEIEDEKTKEKKRIGKFTLNKKYIVCAIYDGGQGYTDFLVGDDEGLFHWINMSVFRSR